MSEKRVLVFPGFLRSKQAFLPFQAVDFWAGEKLPKNINDYYFLVGSSLGASLVLKKYSKDFSGKFILINPNIGKKSLFVFAFNAFKILIPEKKSREHIVNFKFWFGDFYKALSLLKIDVSDYLKDLPKEKFLIIRSKFDDYFCDWRAVELMKQREIDFVEVATGHNWDDKIKDKVLEIIGN